MISTTENYQTAILQFMRTARESFKQGDEIVRISIVPVNKKEKGFKVCVSVKSGNCTKSFKYDFLEEASDNALTF